MPISESTTQRISRKVHDLIELNQPGLVDRQLIRTIMNGGKEAIGVLLSKEVAEKQVELPVANLIVSAQNRLAYKLGKVPLLRIDAPQHRNSQTARRQADKRQRIILGWDEQNELPLLYPQLGRWLPGYGMISGVIKQGHSLNGHPYPKIEIRDPYETYPGEWGTDQTPKDIAYVRVADPKRLAKIFPKHASRLQQIERGMPHGGVSHSPAVVNDRVSGTIGDQNWENQSGQGILLYEYYNNEGQWWVLPNERIVLHHIPNPLSTPPFVAMKRFTFDKMVGQFNHAIGLLAAIARINLNLIIAIEDGVHAETNIIGEFSGKYKRGRGQVNRLSANSKVERPRSPIPFEAFQQASRLDDQLRVISNYPVQEDSVSPNSFVTGRGLEELRTSVSQEVSEYYVTLRHFQLRFDTKRLEWADKLYSRRKLIVNGIEEGTPYAESYTPSTHINGNYISNRIFGMMTGWDEPTKIITGLQLLQAEIIDPDTFRDNLDGITNPQMIAEKIEATKSKNMMMEMMVQLAMSGNPQALEVLIEMMPEGETKNKIQDLLIPDPNAQPQQPQVPGGQGGQSIGANGQPESTQTILERLTNTGQPFAGVQTVRS